MKRISFFPMVALLAALALASCSGNNNSVQVKLLPSNSGRIYFGYCDAQGDKVKEDDTVAVKDGIAILDVKRYADKNPIAYFFYPEQGDQVYFLPQSGSLTFTEQENVNGDPDGGSTFVANASSLSNDNQKFQELYAFSSKINGIGKSLNEKYQIAAYNNDKERIDSIRNAFGEFIASMKEETKKFVADNIANPAGQVALANNLDLYKFNIVDFDAVVNNLPDGNLKNDLLARMEPARKIQPGQQFIEVALPTPQGDTLRLSEIVAKSKVTLLDFWASWCGPCRQFNPILVEIYKQFHDKGFNIYGVSLDQDKEQWTKAIKEQNLTWNHVSNLKAWDCPARLDYMVQGIPSSVLIGQDGKIIAHNLEGNELKAKLAELLAE
jgi:hypothetical protein